MLVLLQAVILNVSSFPLVVSTLTSILYLGNVILLVYRRIIDFAYMMPGNDACQDSKPIRNGIDLLSCLSLKSTIRIT